MGILTQDNKWNFLLLVKFHVFYTFPIDDWAKQSAPRTFNPILYQKSGKNIKYPRDNRKLHCLPCLHYDPYSLTCHSRLLTTHDTGSSIQQIVVQRIA